MNTQFFTQQSSVQNIPHFFLSSEVLTDGVVALHLRADHLPENFLGIAFHLPVSGPEWSFNGSKLEENWNLQRQNLFVMTSFKDTDGARELVFGLSKKGDVKLSPASLQDGTMVTFFLKMGAGDYAAHFDHAVVSVDTGEKRVDLPQVSFEGIIFGSGKGLESQKGVPDLPIERIASQSDIQDLFTTQETDFPHVQPGFTKFLGANVIAQNSYESVFQVYYVTIIFTLILLLGVGLAYVCHRLLQRKR